MDSRSISIRCLVAVVMWILGSAIVVLDAFNVANVGDLGIVFAMAGATLHVRGFFTALARREQNAFVLGRDYEYSRLKVVD